MSVFLSVNLLFLSLDWSGVLVNNAGEISCVHLIIGHFLCLHTKSQSCTYKYTDGRMTTTFSSLPPPQAVNFALVPPVARTVFLGGIALTFTIYLCHLRQQHGHKLE